MTDTDDLIAILSNKSVRKQVMRALLATTKEPERQRATYKPSVIRTCEPEQFELLLAAMSTRKSTEAKNQAIALLMWETGMRVGEVCSMKPEHIDRAKKQIRVPRCGKTGERYIPLPRGAAGERLLAALDRWEAQRNPSAEFYFHTNPTANAPGLDSVNVESVQRTFRRACKAAGLPRIHPHMLRHSRATMLLQKGYNIADVAQFLGHKSPMTTAETYLHSDVRRLHELADRFAED